MNKILIAFVIPFLCIGCKSTKSLESDFAKQGYSILTVLDKRKVDGCQFLLTDDNNKIYEPINLPDSVRVSGLKIGAKFSFMKGGVSACMGGPLIKISDIIYLKK